MQLHGARPTGRWSVVVCANPRMHTHCTMHQMSIRSCNAPHSAMSSEFIIRKQRVIRLYMLPNHNKTRKTKTLAHTTQGIRSLVGWGHYLTGPRAYVVSLAGDQTRTYTQRLGQVNKA